MTLIAKEPGAAIPPAAAPPGSAPPTPTPTSGSLAQVVRLLVVLAIVTAIFLAAGLGDLLLFIAILIVIVMLHELGHFATAKWSGMKVTEYFVGFGPRLWSVRRGETEYGVKAIPAGGYVRITGFTVLEEVAEEDEPRTYRQQPFWKRLIVGSAGSAMHFIIALVLAFIVVLSFGVSSNNVQVAQLDHWQGVARTPAQVAGLRSGDVITSVNGKALNGIDNLTKAIAGSAGTPITIGFERDGQAHQVTVTPQKGQGITLSGAGGQKLSPNKGYIGIALEPATASENPLRAVGTAFANVGSYTSQEVGGIVKTFSASGIESVYHQVTNSKDAAKAAKNPNNARPVSLVGIASLGVQAQQAGLVDLLNLLILINIIFGLINMLPMIPLDGGHVAVAAYEWIRTRKGQPYYRADITKLFPVVFVFVAVLLVLVFSGVFLDITHPIKLP
ncbi:MAG TPA: site-2 protease family protein [Acidimicrobiales bacterium]|jgi:membrane-associated protease RseP (regulator of RpoE activity)|nr:site-2 protease family protein [Acidimicrobiales bacterium]